MADFIEEEDETLEDEEEDAAPAPKAGMSNSDMIGAALIALAPALLGGAMGGKQGALAGAAAGTGAAGGALKSIGDDQKAAELARAKRDQSFSDFREREDYKRENATEKDPGTTKVTYRKGGKEITELVPNVPGAKFEGDVPPKAGPKDTTEVDPKEYRTAAAQAQRQFNVSARPYVTALNSAKETEKLAGMAKENPRAAGALMGKLARAAGEVGVLSDADIKRLGGSESVQARIERFSLLSTTDQKITDEDIRSAQELARQMQTSARDNLNSLTDSQVTSFVSIYGGNRDDAYRKITGMDPPKADAPKEESTSAGLQIPYSPKYTEELQSKARAILERRRQEREQAGKSNGKNGG